MSEFRQDLHQERGLNIEVLTQFSNMTESMLEGGLENLLGYHFQLPESTTPSSLSNFPCVTLLKCQNEFPITRTGLLVDNAQETMKRKAKQESESNSGALCAARPLKASVNSSTNCFSCFELLVFSFLCLLRTWEEEGKEGTVRKNRKSLQK